MDSDDEVPEEKPRDSTIDAAITRVRAFFNESPRRLFYSTQIETTLERDFFHWITGRALLELAEAEQIQRAPFEVQQKLVNFYAHSQHRYWRREQRDIAHLLERIFDPDFSQAVGRHGELMFDAAFGRYGFRIEDLNARRWRGEMWTETNHNLDRIITRDGLEYGVEIKNTQNYISREELEIKLRICRRLGIIPLFIIHSPLHHEVRSEILRFQCVSEWRVCPFVRGANLSLRSNRAGCRGSHDSGTEGTFT